MVYLDLDLIGVVVVWMFGLLFWVVGIVFECLLVLGGLYCLVFYVWFLGYGWLVGLLVGWIVVWVCLVFLFMLCGWCLVLLVVIYSFLVLFYYY